MNCSRVTGLFRSTASSSAVSVMLTLVLPSSFRSDVSVRVLLPQAHPNGGACPSGWPHLWQSGMWEPRLPLDLFVRLPPSLAIGVCRAIEAPSRPEGPVGQGLPAGTDARICAGSSHPAIGHG